MIQNRAIVTGPTFISLGLMGAFFAFWGTTLPAVRVFLDINIEKAALLTACGQASHAVVCLLGGILSDLMRRDRVLMAGCFSWVRVFFFSEAWIPIWPMCCSSCGWGLGAALF